MKKQNVLLPILTVLAVLALFIFYFINRNGSSEPLLISGSNAFRNETANSSVPQSISRININTATVEQLQTLPGIGPSLAQRIIDYRTANGPFRAVSELSKVSGIGLSRLDQIIDYITAGGSQ